MKVSKYRIAGNQCAAGRCTKKAQAGKSYCAGRVCGRTSESRFGRSKHVNVAEARRDAKLGIDPVTGDHFSPMIEPAEVDPDLFDDNTRGGFGRRDRSGGGLW